MKRLLQAVLLAVLGCLGTSRADAACTLSWVNLNFGTYTGALDTGVNTATVNCPNGNGYTIGLNAGTGSGATTTIRKMTGPNGATLSYEIFQNSTRTTNWGNTNGVDDVTGTGTGSNQTINAYSQVLAGQAVVPGTYTDTISTATTTFTVTATVQATCSFSATALSFGTYTGLVLNAASSISITCTNTTAYSIGLNAGTSTGATVTNRLLTGAGGVEINYGLYTDSARTVNWGSTSGTVSGTGNGSAQGISVYGKLPAGQYVKPGTYTDTITATVTY